MKASQVYSVSKVICFNVVNIFVKVLLCYPENIPHVISCISFRKTSRQSSTKGFKNSSNLIA